MPTSKGEQGPYWGVVNTDVAAWSYITFTLEAGFTPTEAWVQTGYKFILVDVEISADISSLLRLAILRESSSTPGTYYSVGHRWGYGTASIKSDMSHFWYAGQRPAYRISNYNRTSSIDTWLNIYGINERVI